MNYNDLSSTVPQVGKILIASPFLDKTPFARSVILLLTYENGFMGIVLNKKHEKQKTVNSLVDSLKDAPIINTYEGGIVDKDILFCMHTNKHIKNSLRLKEGLYINGDFSQIEEMAITSRNLNKEARFYLGYAGWAEGQLEQEIADGSWVVSEADIDLLFIDDIRLMWSTALKRMGKPCDIWIQFPLEPLLN